MRLKLIIALSALLTALAIHDAHAQTGGGFPPSQPPIKICPTAGGCTVSLKVGQSALLYKATSTGRNTTATLAVDPDMQFTCSNCISFYAYGTVVYNITTAAQGIKMQAMGSNTCVSLISTQFAVGETTGLFAGQDWAANSFINTSGTGTFFFSTSGGYGVSSPNSWFLCWSQAVSGATNTFLTSGTTMIFTRTQ